MRHHPTITITTKRHGATRGSFKLVTRILSGEVEVDRVETIFTEDDDREHHMVLEADHHAAVIDKVSTALEAA